MSIKGSVFLGLALLISSFFWVSRIQEPRNYIPKPYYKIPINAEKNDTVRLGQLLFYDNILSANNEVSCASCHNSYNAFAHTDHELSHGIFDSIGNRNAPGLFNLAWQKELFWDGAAHHIESQALAPLSDPNELGSSIEKLIDKLRSSDFYRAEFFDVYGDSLINSKRVLGAISSFELSLISFGAKYDQVKQGATSFSEQEENGYRLFSKHCNQCHAEPLFSSFEYRDNGLQADTILDDQGRFLVTGDPKDKYKFKVPSLRNISYTYPYMHDGRFQNINEVLDHYESKKKGKTDLRKPIKMNFNDRADLISFLLTLNDKAFVFNPTHSFPEKLKEELMKN